MLPETDIFEALREQRKQNGKQALQTALALYLPRKLAQTIAEEIGATGHLADMSDKMFLRVEAAINDWRIKPAGSEGYRTAEVTLGGSIRAISTPRPWKPNPFPACFSSAKSSMLPAGSAAIISSGHGLRAG